MILHAVLEVRRREGGNRAEGQVSSAPSCNGDGIMSAEDGLVGVLRVPRSVKVMSSYDDELDAIWHIRYRTPGRR